MTAETVHFLELRAPSASKRDRDAITLALQRGAIFPHSSPQDKRMVKSTLLHLNCIIPSIKSLHDNQKLLRVGVRIIRSVIMDPAERTMTSTCLKSMWTFPQNTFTQLNDLPEFEQDGRVEEPVAWWRAYIQIWLFVIRHFPYLSATSTPTPVGPRLEDGQKRGGQHTAVSKHVV